MELSICCSVRLGVFLRRYPVARVFIIVYMVSCYNCSLLVLCVCGLLIY